MQSIVFGNESKWYMSIVEKENLSYGYGGVEAIIIINPKHPNHIIWC